MATTRHRYVDPDASGTPADGTTWAKAYRSLSTAENGEDNTGDLVSRDEIVVFHCRSSSGTADTTGTTFSGWTTDATRYIVIVAEAVNTSYGGGSSETTDTGRHHGIWSTAHYRLSVSNAAPLTISEEFVRLHGLQFESVSPSAAGKHCVFVSGIATPNAFYCSDSLIRGHAHATYTQDGIWLNDADTNADIWNCIIYNFAAIASNYPLISSATTGNTVNVYSCVLIGGANALRNSSTGTLNAKNVYGGGSATEDFNNASTGTLNKTNCASEDQSADDTGANETATNCVAAAVAIDTDTFVNVSAGTQDYHLAADGLSPLQGAGVDTSGESAPLNFTTDIDGDTIINWSIGADDGVGATALSGTSPSIAWAVAAIALVAGSVALAGTSPSTSWNTAGTFHATTALSGASPSAAWTPATLTLTATAALAGTQPSAVWAPASLELEAGAVALSGTSPVATWQPAAIDLEVAGQDLSGPSPAASWLVPSLALEPGSAALSGTSATAAWAAAAIDLEAGAVALSGTSPSASWSVPVLVLAPGSVALAGPSPSAIWQVPVLDLVSEGGPQSLSGLSASANWLVPALQLAAGSVALTGASPGASWALPALNLTAETALVGTTPSASWLVPSLSLQAGTVALVGVSPEATWLIAAIDVYASSSQTLVGVSAESLWTVPTLRLTGGPRILELVATVGEAHVMPGTSNPTQTFVGSAPDAADLVGSTG